MRRGQSTDLNTIVQAVEDELRRTGGREPGRIGGGRKPGRLESKGREAGGGSSERTGTGREIQNVDFLYLLID